MNETIFWCQKNFVEYCLRKNNIKVKYSIETIGRGHRGVEMWIHKIKNTEFVNKYGNIFDSDLCSIYLNFPQKVHNDNNCGPFYVSVKKK